MRRPILIATALAAVACSADQVGGPKQNAQPPGPQAAATVSLIGIVVQHPQGEVWLLRHEGEIQLLGAIDAALPHIGREVLVAGRFVSINRFWVEFVRPINSGPPQ